MFGPFGSLSMDIKDQLVERVAFFLRPDSSKHLRMYLILNTSLGLKEGNLHSITGQNAQLYCTN